MKIGLRILAGYCLIVGLAAWFLLNVFMEEVKPGVRSTQEDTLIDSANLLAELVADDVKAGAFAQSASARRLQAYAARRVDLDISGIAKHQLNSRVYLTDAQGVVLFDSTGRDTGKDYSRWNDVYRTLRGQYGARSSRTVAHDDNSSVMYVAAPVRDGARIIGALTLAKPNASVQMFVERSQRKILHRGALLLSLSLLIGIAFTFWLAQALRQLMVYIGEVEAGRKAVLPRMGRHEIGTLGRALEALRYQLEGKQYVEQLMHTLAHELKSPIAAIQGSAELLSEAMPLAERRHFLATILNQNTRQKQLIDRLLELVRLEKLQHLTVREPVDMAALLAQVATDFAARLLARRLALECQADPALPTLQGDALLLRQALGNLLDNAISFAPQGSVIFLAAQRRGAALRLTVRDQGAGIPDYASARLFERFYSLPRPDGAKSTGLGLPFVREVALLHHGSVTVQNHGAGGVCATLDLPLLLTAHTMLG